jgi:hypothetical protein
MRALRAARRQLIDVVRVGAHAIAGGQAFAFGLLVGGGGGDGRDLDRFGFRHA